MTEAQLILVYQKKKRERQRIHWITKLIRYSDWAVRILNFQLKFCLPIRSDGNSHPHQTVLLTAADWFTGEVVSFCNPMDYSLPDSTVHGIFQARILKWVAISFSRDLPDPGIKSVSPARQAVSWAGGFFTPEPRGKSSSKTISIITTRFEIPGGKT